MLLDEAEQTIGIARASLEAAKDEDRTKDRKYFIDTLGIDEEEKAALLTDAKNPSEIDPVVRFLIGATCGRLYRPLIGRVQTYPVPKLRLPKGGGRLFLDIGCNWGRWCIAAGRQGYKPVGIDPSLGAVLAARRVSSQLGVVAHFIVADARYLPFAKGSFDVVFSYSVLQHFSRENVRKTLGEIARVLRADGISFIQMANSLGLRSQLHLAKRLWKSGSAFEVRYWRPSQLRKTFAQVIGPSTLSAEGYFGLGMQASDLSLLPWKYRVVVRASEGMRALSAKTRWLVRFADSIYVTSQRG